jgi:hypothetical protein
MSGVVTYRRVRDLSGDEAEDILPSCERLWPMRGEGKFPRSAEHLKVDLAAIDMWLFAKSALITQRATLSRSRSAAVFLSRKESQRAAAAKLSCHKLPIICARGTTLSV